MIAAISGADAAGAYEDFWSSMFPWMKGQKADLEVRMHAAVKKWTAIPKVEFRAPNQDPLQKIARKLQMPDEFKQKLREKARKDKKR